MDKLLDGAFGWDGWKGTVHDGFAVPIGDRLILISRVANQTESGDGWEVRVNGRMDGLTFGGAGADRSAVGFALGIRYGFGCK